MRFVCRGCASHRKNVGFGITCDPKNEKEEITILESYLPTPLTDEEIVAAVEESIAETASQC